MDINKLFIKLKQNQKKCLNIAILFYTIDTIAILTLGKEDPYRGAIDSMFLFPQISHVKILISNVMVLETGIFGR